MRKIKKISIIFMMLLLTGCSSEKKMLYTTYADNNNISSMLSTENDDLSTSSLFASNLCVIPIGTDTGGDSNLVAKSEILVNATDNEVVYANNVYEKLYPASLTKIITALTAIKHSDLNSVVTVTENVGGITESGAKLCNLKKGQQIVLKDLLTALIIYSGNDAGVEIARHVSGSVEEFAKLMNQDAKELGAVNSNFVNPHGLHDDNHYTTTYDLYLIYNELLKNDFFMEISGKASFEMPYTTSTGAKGSNKYENTNEYLLGKSKAPDGVTVIGGKTGTTVKAGKCLSLACSDQEGDKYIAIILYACDMNSSTLYTQMTHMIGKIVE